MWAYITFACDDVYRVNVDQIDFYGAVYTINTVDYCDVCISGENYQTVGATKAQLDNLIGT